MRRRPCCGNNKPTTVTWIWTMHYNTWSVATDRHEGAAAGPTDAICLPSVQVHAGPTNLTPPLIRFLPSPSSQKRHRRAVSEKIPKTRTSRVHTWCQRAALFGDGWTPGGEICGFGKSNLWRWDGVRFRAKIGCGWWREWKRGFYKEKCFVFSNFL